MVWNNGNTHSSPAADPPPPPCKTSSLRRHRGHALSAPTSGSQKRRSGKGGVCASVISPQPAIILFSFTTTFTLVVLPPPQYLPSYGYLLQVHHQRVLRRTVLLVPEPCPRSTPGPSMLSPHFLLHLFRSLHVTQLSSDAAPDFCPYPGHSTERLENNSGFVGPPRPDGPHGRPFWPATLLTPPLPSFIAAGPGFRPPFPSRGRTPRIDHLAQSLDCGYAFTRNLGGKKHASPGAPVEKHVRNLEAKLLVQHSCSNNTCSRWSFLYLVPLPGLHAHRWLRGMPLLLCINRLHISHAMPLKKNVCVLM
ncbi:hypothetical protein LX36DRAFT_128182 [Colletotrichum falcatum]|nr:hypothetical protein LX36DRAFT_128182 [Colletotrichum falcatum]